VTWLHAASAPLLPLPTPTLGPCPALSITLNIEWSRKFQPSPLPFGNVAGPREERKQQPGILERELLGSRRVNWRCMQELSMRNAFLGSGGGSLGSVVVRDGRGQDPHLARAHSLSTRPPVFHPPQQPHARVLQPLASQFSRASQTQGRKPTLGSRPTQTPPTRSTRRPASDRTSPVLSVATKPARSVPGNWYRHPRYVPSGTRVRCAHRCASRRPVA
jgi:hypothetical protein